MKTTPRPVVAQKRKEHDLNVLHEDNELIMKEYTDIMREMDCSAFEAVEIYETRRRRLYYEGWNLGD